MSQAFISYHRAQRKLARLIAHRIAADGHAVWWDRSEKPGDSWSEAVSTALAGSACVIVLWSKQAAASPWVLGEATAGFGRGALISVLSDKTQPPSPFDRGPVIDMHGWEGESVDLAWIRLRDPVRAKLAVAEKAAVLDAPLPPGRPPPLRVGFSSATGATEPPVQERRYMERPPERSYAAPPYQERRSASPLPVLAVLALGGLGATGWYYREDVRAQALQWQASLAEPPREMVAIPAPTPPLEPVSAPASVAPEMPAEIAEGPLQPMAPSAVVAASAAPPVPVMTRTYEDWRDTYVPPPVLRTLPRTATEPAVAMPVERAAEAAPPPPAATRPGRLTVQQGQFIDVDGPGTPRQSDLWFSPDRTGYGLFLGVAHGARLRTANGARVSMKSCSSGVLRRNPVSARELQRDGGLCLRSSEGVVSAWRVDSLERTGSVSVLRLVAVGP